MDALLAEPKSQTSSSQEQSESLKEQLKIYADIEKLLNPPQIAEQSKNFKSDGPPSTKNAPRKSPEKAGTKRSHSPSSDSAATAAKKLAPNVPRGKSRIETRLEAAAPYNFLLTKIKDEPSTHNDNHR